MVGAISSTFQRLGYDGPTQFANLTGFVKNQGTRREIRIIRHPLWNDWHPQWIEAEANARKQYPKHEIKQANPFLIALRRPGDDV